jgi:DNA polymerase I-like protein with 3'-5' exonuclease and polymerase domains
MLMRSIVEDKHIYTPSEWIMPTELPDLTHETEVSIDTETFDPGLRANKGPGFFKCDQYDNNTGYICGISAAWRNEKVYIPLRHASRNYFNRALVGQWLKSLVAQNHTRFIFHNFQYDWGWIQAMFDIPPPALIDDTMAMASIIDENRFSFDLDSLCEWQKVPGKKKLNVSKNELYKLPPEMVGDYAEQDAISTLELYYKLLPILEEENLNAAYQVERELMPITLRMKQKGIRVSTLRAKEIMKSVEEQNYKDSEIMANLLEEEGIKIQRNTQQDFFGRTLPPPISLKDIRSSRWVKKKFEQLDIRIEEFTAKKNPKFDKSVMTGHRHWFPRMVQKIKHQADLADKFLQKFIVAYAHNGRVHPTINQFKSETGGAKSHRFSYSDPPLQQMPSRDDAWAPLVRSCFLPEEGEFWCSIDYRQQEYRLIVFVAELLRARGAKKAADRYRNDPSTDFHNYVAQITRLERPRAKDTNFAKAYGAGIRKFALMTGMDEDEARDVYNQYDAELPFVREASDRYMNYAAKHGYIKLIDGARNHFNLFEPIEYRDFTEPGVPYACPYDEAIRRTRNPNHSWYGQPIKRAHVHKAFNRMIQGSAARQTKKAMLDLVKAGYQPVLQLHDELCFSLTDMKQAKECARIMEEAMPVITIPMLTDVKCGPNWGQLKK